MDFGVSDLGAYGMPQTAATYSPEVQAYIQQLKAYEDAKKAEGYLVRANPSHGSDYSAMLAANVRPEDAHQLGYQFVTNAGKKAKTKANPTAQVFLDPSMHYNLINERGQNVSAASGMGAEALATIYAKARELSGQGGKANWKLVQQDPVTGVRTTIADDDPKSKLGKLADIALPALGALLMPVTGGMSGALAAGLGAAGGSIVSGIAQGKGIGDILKGAAISGGLSFAGGSLLGGATGGASGFNPSALTNMTNSAINSGIQGGLSSAAGGVAGGVGSALGNVAGSFADDIVVNGIRSGAGSLAAGVGGAAGAVTAGALGSATGGNQPNDIVVEGQKPTTPGVSPMGTVAAGAAAAGSAVSNAANAAKPNDGLSASDIARYLQLASLGVGMVGNVLGGGKGGSGGTGTIPGGGGLNPIFSGSLPTANIPGVGPASNLGVRQMPSQDWERYGQRPEQSFMKYVPQGYTPPLPGEKDDEWDKYAEGGEVDLAVRGPGTGRDDKIPALLSDGEYVVDAETVALLGDGSSKAGAQALDALRVNIRKHKGRGLAKGKFSDNAKKPDQYLKGGTK